MAQRADSAASESGGVRRRDAVLLCAIVLSAFAIRLVYVFQLSASPLFEVPIMDEAYNVSWGRAIAAGKSWVEGAYFRAPLYPAFLGAVFRVFGDGLLVPRVLQAVLGALSCGLLFEIGRRVFDRRVAVLAGCAAASYWVLVYFDAELLIPVLIVFLDLAMLLLLVSAAEQPRALRYAAAGLILGLSAIARPNVLLFAPAVATWMFIARGESSRQQASGWVLAFALCCALPILPITVRNYLVADDLVLVSSQAGVNFYIGNNPKSDGMTAIVPGTPGTWWGGYTGAIARAEQARGRELDASEVSAYYLGESWKFVRAEPAQYAALNARKLALFWSHWEIPNNKILYFWTDRFTPVVDFLPLGFAVIGPLGLVGIALCWRRPRETFPLWGFAIVYTASVVVFFCNARYRVPVLPILILLGSHTIVWVADALRARRYGDSLRAGLGLVASLAIVNLVPEHPMLREQPMSHLRLANGYLVTGQPERAIESYAAVLALEPGHLIARQNLGRTLLQVGRSEDGIEQLQRVLRAADRRPGLLSRENRVRGYEDLADAFELLGRGVEASAALRRADALTGRVGSAE